MKLEERPTSTDYVGKTYDEIQARKKLQGLERTKVPWLPFALAAVACLGGALFGYKLRSPQAHYSVSHAGGEVFLVDTVSGDTWRYVSDSNDPVTFWVYVPRPDTRGKMEAALLKNGIERKPEPTSSVPGFP